MVCGNVINKCIMGIFFEYNYIFFKKFKICVICFYIVMIKCFCYFIKIILIFKCVI